MDKIFFPDNFPIPPQVSNRAYGLELKLSSWKVIFIFFMKEKYV